MALSTMSGLSNDDQVRRKRNPRMIGCCKPFWMTTVSILFLITMTWPVVW